MLGYYFKHQIKQNRYSWQRVLLSAHATEGIPSYLFYTLEVPGGGGRRTRFFMPKNLISLLFSLKSLASQIKTQFKLT